MTLLVPALVLGVSVPLILNAGMVGRQGFDQINFHEPAIRIFAHDWPRFDLVHYLSATTPGYHLALAAWARFALGSSASLQLAAHAFTFLLLALVSWRCLARGRAGVAIACVLALAASRYVFFPGVWLLPDNAGWCLVVAILLIALRERWDWVGVAIGSAALLALVMVRQSHAWALAPLLVGAWFARSAGSIGRGAITLAGALPAALALAWFAKRWGGLTPPLFQAQMHAPGAPRVNLAAPAFVLALVGVYAPAFAATILPALADLWRTHRRRLALIVAGAALLALVPQTTFSREHGRWGALWTAAALGGPREGRPPVTELFAHTNVVIAALAIAGAVTLGTLLSRATERERWVVTAALAGFAASFASTGLVFQRYAEPLVLIVLAMLVSHAEGCEPSRPARSALARLRPSLAALGPLLLALVLALGTARQIRRDEAQRVLPRDELMRDVFPNAPAGYSPRLLPSDPIPTLPG